jgi:hypothetical protein
MGGVSLQTVSSCRSRFSLELTRRFDHHNVLMWAAGVVIRMTDINAINLYQQEG